MVLSDQDILREIAASTIKIESPDDNEPYVRCASVDLRLGNLFKIFKNSHLSCIDLKNPQTLENLMETINVKEEEAFIVHPGEFLLGVTVEKITIPDNMIGRLEGRSSLGRLGIIVHSTAGFFDPGFSGTGTLEISNLNRIPISLYPGMRICQMAFERLESPAKIPYNQKPDAKYMNQIDPEASRITKEMS